MKLARTYLGSNFQEGKKGASGNNKIPFPLLSQLHVQLALPTYSTPLPLVSDILRIP